MSSNLMRLCTAPITQHHTASVILHIMQYTVTTSNSLVSLRTVTDAGFVHKKCAANITNKSNN